MGEKEVILSLEGLKRLEQELEHLKSVKRREVADRIKQAREFGDIGENSEYDDAKNEQAFVEGRIITLEKLLRNAKIIDEAATDPNLVSLGASVRLREVESGDVLEYTIVGSTEANPSANRISNESPVGKAVVGQKIGTTVEVQVPAGTFHYEILGVFREAAGR